MQLIQDIKGLKLDKVAMCIGKFDAIHSGHQKLIKDIVAKKEEGYRAVVMTFDFSKKGIFTLEERLYIFEKLGVDIVIKLDFDIIKDIEAEYFLSEVLVKNLGVEYLACGDDFLFGKNKKGDINLLKAYKNILNYELKIFDKVYYKSKPISSSRIIQDFKDGNIEEVNKMLEHTVFLYGKVVKGNQIGRTIGVPTANIDWPNDKIMPPNGVYAAKINVHGRFYIGVANIGVKPTIGKNSPLIEVNIFDFNQDIYDEKIYIHLYYFSRAEMKYKSISELEKVLNNDIKNTKEYFNKTNINLILN